MFRAVGRGQGSIEPGGSACKGSTRAAAALPADPLPTSDPQAFVDELEAWAEDEARTGGEQLQQLADWAEDRKNPPKPDAIEAAAAASPLALTREVKSASRRYLLSAMKVDRAFGLLAAQLEAAAAAAVGWSDRSAQRQLAILGKLSAVNRRRASMRQCVLGRVAVRVYRCTSCGGMHPGAEQTCQQRVCPRCCQKLRKQAQAHVMDLLDVVDRRRQQRGAAPARWRFLTLTVPSLPKFLPMRHLVARSWGKLLRSTSVGMRRVQVRQLADGSLQRKPVGIIGAAVASMETTHTRAGWHVHVHALVDAFLPRAGVVRAWQQILFGELLRDAQNGRQIYQGDPIRDCTVRAARALQRIARAAPLTEASTSADGQPCARVVQLAEFVERALEVARIAPGDRAAARSQLAELLALTPTEVGVHLSEPKGDRRAIVRELSKYLAKDLAGSSTDEADEMASEWGVAGTSERLAEFIAGIHRWRALRAYGAAYDAQAELEKIKATMSCTHCGSEDLEFLAVEWCTDAEAARYRREYPRRKLPDEAIARPPT